MELVAGLSARDSMDMVPADWRDLIPRYYPRLRHSASEPVEGQADVVVPDGWRDGRNNGRMDFGRFEAAWLRDLAGTITLTHPSGGGSGTSLGTVQVGRWWEQATIDAKLDYATRLAAAVDGILPAITWSYVMTFYPECFLRQIGGNAPEATANRAAFEALGWEHDAHERPAWYALIDGHFERFRTTRTIVSFNPGHTRRGTRWDAADKAWTLEIMDHVASSYPDRVILYNNSLNRDRATGAYRWMYEAMADWRTKGVPIGVQTSVAAKMTAAEYEWSLDFACDIGCHILEVPNGFERLAARAKHEAVDARLKANVAG